MKNDTFIRALLKKNTRYTPIWLMRQAGRYLVEYQATRKKAGNFLNLCKNIDLATEVTLQPIDKFNLDAAILFSDILTIPDAMGLGLYFVEKEGPKFKQNLQQEENINKLTVPNMEKLNYVFQIVTSIKKALNNKVPLIGFSGSPFTLACYMIEGGSSKDFLQTKKMLFQRSDLLHKILEINTQAIILYLNEQIKAGVDAIQIFDTWGGILNYNDYKTFSLKYMQDIVNNIIRNINGINIPIIIFTKNSMPWIEDIANSNINAISIDSNCSIKYAKKLIGDKVTIQGNLDPMTLFGSDDIITKEVNNILEDFGYGNGHIFNLGHGVNQYTPPEKVKLLVDLVHNLSIKYHKNNG